MLCYCVLFVLQALNTVGTGGTCPAPCRCPSVYVTNCVSAALRKFPSDKYIFETLLSLCVSVCLSVRAFVFRVETGDFYGKLWTK